ncbi:MAG TPA: oligosaccharide flippase family protein, partial [Polyangiaceae bacterium]|nr:oligosaccharide flippase family protein [Polyangiaceae bacterium]
MEASEQPRETPPPVTSDGRKVLRNTIYLSAAQVLTIPISIAVSGMTAHHLGPVEFGYLYLGYTFCGFAFILVEWGQQGVLPAVIARDHSRAGGLLGASLAWRFAAAIVTYIVLAVVCHLAGYGAEPQWAIGLSFCIYTLSSLIAAFRDVIRGFERTDIPAYAQVGQQLLVVTTLATVFALGGKMRGALGSQIFAAAVVAVVLWRAMRLVGVRSLTFERGALKGLLKEGTPFVFFNLALALQPNIDAVYLSKLAPPEVTGWFAVRTGLVAALLFPASALLGALYPTLSRLYTTDLKSFIQVARGALHSVALVVVPVALGCALYPEIGTSIYSRKSFIHSEDDLRVSALFLFLVYFSMPLGSCIVAAGKQRAWSVVQGMCVVVSLVLDPLLLPWFQRHTGNGGIGICVALAISEALVVTCGVALAPRGIFDRRFARGMGLALFSGGVMTLAAYLMKPITPFVAAPIAVAAYAVALIATGGIEKA